MRNFLAIALIPATAGFIATQKMSIKPAAIHGSIYIIIMTMLLLNSFFPATMQPLSIITNRQTEFLKLPKAHSQIKLTPLTPNIKSYIKNLPEAIDHGFLQPYFFNTKHWTGTIASTEWFLLFLLPLTFVLVFRREIQIESNFIWFGFMIAFTMFLMIGYIIPNLNSIIRYKSIYLPFIITPILYVASLNKLEKTH